MNPITILVVTDLHYTSNPDNIHAPLERKIHEVLAFLEKTLEEVKSKNPDLILLLGDLVDQGSDPFAEKDLQSIYAVLKKTGVPIIVVPGNHDYDAQMLFRIFEDFEGLHNVKGYQIISFADTCTPGDITLRSMEKMERFFAQADPALPLLVLQHNPVYPHIDSPYPFNIQKADEIMAFYTEKGVLLSLSGHAHWGMPLEIKDEVGYITCPCLCEAPFRYTLIQLNNREYEITEKRLGE